MVNHRSFLSDATLMWAEQVVLRWSLSLRCVYSGIVEHELNHALDFYHEHTRSDHNSYVTINSENISPTIQSNFNRKNSNNLKMACDYSVMHYRRTALDGHHSYSASISEH